MGRPNERRERTELSLSTLAEATGVAMGFDIR